MRQQISLADVTGFVEEHMNGQRVVKVFNHEQKSKEEFDQLNESLFDSASQANKYANMMGPVIGNIGNLQFVLTAVLGGILSVAGVGGITLGVMASYLQFTKSFTQPFMQVAQQFNSIVMALAGAERIFALIDEKPETDEGYVTLVNAKRDASGNIIECKEHTGMWAWKHPHSADGSVSYTPLTGDVRFEDVTFGYNPDKVILKDISLFAKPGQKLAFVGSTGAGKTTITNLINRFMIFRKERSATTASILQRLKKTICVVPSVLYCRIPTCLLEPSVTTSVTEILTRQMNRFTKRQNWRMLTSLSRCFQMAMIPCSAAMVKNCPRDSASCFLSQELPWQIHRFSSSMKQRPASIPVPRVLCKKVWIT